MSDQRASVWDRLNAPPSTQSPPRPDGGTAQTPPALPSTAANTVWDRLQRPASQPAPPTDWGHALWEGIKRGGRDVLEGGAQIGARMQAAGPEEGAGAFDDPAARAAMPGRVDQAVAQSAQDYARNPAVQANPITAFAGRIGGNVAATAPLLAIPGVGLGGGAARTGAGILARGAATGGAGAALQPALPQQQTHPYGMPSGQPAAPGQAPPRPTALPQAIPAADYWGEKLKQATIGAVVGAAIPGAGSVLSPRLPSTAAVKAIPQEASYVARAFRPLYNFFTGAEERTTAGFDRTVARQVLDPIGGTIDKRLSGHELLRETEDQISKVYDKTLPHITLSKAAGTAPDHELDNFVATMSDDHIRRFNTLVDRTFNSRFGPGDVMDGTTFQRARSEMGKRASSWLGTNDDELGRAVMMKINNLQDAVVKTSPPEFAQPLQRANESWRMWVRMRQAGSSSRKEGDFSPDDLLKAVYRQDRGAAWRGDRPLQGYAQAARAAMGRQPTSLAQLAQIFTHHGLIAQGYEALAGPLARGAKAATPAISPTVGAVTARLAQPPQRRSSLTIAPESRPYVGTSGM